MGAIPRGIKYKEWVRSREVGFLNAAASAVDLYLLASGCERLLTAEAPLLTTYYLLLTTITTTTYYLLLTTC